MACSFNPELIEKMANIIAVEAAALGVNQLFAPVVDLARELRFGRVEETFGEDAFLYASLFFSYHDSSNKVAELGSLAITSSRVYRTRVSRPKLSTLYDRFATPLSSNFTDVSGRFRISRTGHQHRTCPWR
jgi:hypothetical protein